MTEFIQAVLADPRLERISGSLRDLVRPSIRATACCTDGDLPVGASKLGGAPDLPPDLPWPTGQLPYPAYAAPGSVRSYSGAVLPSDGIIHLPFVAQFRLTDLAPHDVEGLLPTTGMLYFFLNEVIYTDESAGHPHGWKVFWLDVQPEDLQRGDTPDSIPEEARFSTCAWTFSGEPTLPQVETCFIGDQGSTEGRLVLTAEEWSAYADLRYRLRGNDRIHQLLGYEDAVQPYPLEYAYSQMESAYPDEDWDLSRREPEGRQKELEDTRLLLQLSDELNGMWYGRDGRLFFYIRERDLAARDFSRVLAVTQ